MAWGGSCSRGGQARGLGIPVEDGDPRWQELRTCFGQWGLVRVDLAYLTQYV